MHIKREEITSQGLILRVSKEGMKSFENNLVVRAALRQADNWLTWRNATSATSPLSTSSS